MADPTVLDTALKFGAPLLTFLLGRWQKAWELAGSDLKDRVDETCKLIDKIADDAWKYWNRAFAEGDPEVERRLVADFEHLEALRGICEEEAPIAFGSPVLIDDTLPARLPYRGSLRHRGFSGGNPEKPRFHWSE